MPCCSACSTLQCLYCCRRPLPRAMACSPFTVWQTRKLSKFRNRSRFKNRKPMGVEYVSVQWNRQKKFYDAVLIGGVAAYLVIFSVLTKILFAHVTDEIMLMRAFGTAAFLLLHVILCIGPLCRFNPNFLPMLYNRRHAGVTMFTLGLIHATLVAITYHAGGDTNPILSIFKGSPLTGSVSGVPFQPFGFFAL